MARDPLNTVLLAYDGLCTFEFGTMVELFGTARPEFEPWYRFRVAGLERGALRASGGIFIETPFTLKLFDTAGTIIIPGWRFREATAPPALLRKLRRAHEQGARILSVCSGAFLLAEAGLLDGKGATTHWMYADILAARYPSVRVDKDVLYVDEGAVITSAGSAAGIDMGLHLIRRDFGTHTANQVARRLVVPPHRDGGQKQFIGAPVGPDTDRAVFARLLDRVRENLRHEHTVESLASMARMSKRTFARRFKEATGTTPHRWILQERVRAVQSLLETTTFTLDQIADQAGFTDTQLMRLHFKRIVGAAPTKYRGMYSKGDCN